MLYLILPPIIVVLAFAGLVYFFSRRYPSVESRLSSEEKISPRGLSESGNSRWMMLLKRLFLNISERVARRLKVITLRAHNAFHRWTQSIREKKLQQTPHKDDSQEMTVDVPSYDSSEVGSKNDQILRPMISRRVVRPTRRFVSETVAVPQIVQEKTEKNQFEDILIERIASNPRDLEAYERLGEYYMEQGNAQDAKECYRQVLRLSPVHRLAKIKIRRLEKMLERK